VKEAARQALQAKLFSRSGKAWPKLGRFATENIFFVPRETGQLRRAEAYSRQTASCREKAIFRNWTFYVFFFLLFFLLGNGHHFLPSLKILGQYLLAH
jgi:hypothetical protein